MPSNLFFGVSINFTSKFKNELPLLYQRHINKFVLTLIKGQYKAQELLNGSFFGDDHYVLNVFNKLFKVY